MSKAVKWLTKNPVAGLTIGGLALYGVIRVAYASFYRRLGVTPEEVGFGYQETLAQSALAVVGMILIGVLGLLAYEMGMRLYVAAVGHLGRRFIFRDHLSTDSVIAQFDEWKTTTNPSRWKAALFLHVLRFQQRLERMSPRDAFRLSPHLIPAWLLAAAALTSVALYGSAWSAANRAEAGHEVAPMTLLGVPFLAVHAEYAAVTPTTAAIDAPLGIPDCSLYLGQSGGTAVFYVPTESGPAATIRIPANEVIVETGTLENACSDRA